MFKIYSVSLAGMVREREAVSETKHTYTLRGGARVRKNSDGDMWCTVLADAYRVRIAAERVKADTMRRQLAVQDGWVAALGAKLAEVEL